MLLMLAFRCRWRAAPPCQRPDLVDNKDGAQGGCGRGGSSPTGVGWLPLVAAPLKGLVCGQRH